MSNNQFENAGEKIATIRALHNKKSSLNARFVLLLGWLLFAASTVCITFHSHKLEYQRKANTELTKTALTFEANWLNEKELRHNEKAAMNKAYGDSLDRIQALTTDNKTLTDVATEYDEKLQESMKMIVENLDENQGLVRDLGESTAILEDYNKRMENLVDLNDALMQVLEHHGVKVEIMAQEEFRRSEQKIKAPNSQQ